MGPVRAVAEPPYGVPRPRREAQAVQRVQGQRGVHSRVQQERQALQAGPEQVRGYDQGRVPRDVRRVQDRPPSDAQGRPRQQRRIHVRGCRRPAFLRRLAGQARRHGRQEPRPLR